MERAAGTNRIGDWDPMIGFDDVEKIPVPTETRTQTPSAVQPVAMSLNRSSYRLKPRD
jgi:hypothetical protein